MFLIAQEKRLNHLAKVYSHSLMVIEFSDRTFAFVITEMEAHFVAGEIQGIRS